jgi:predicted small metal-binding protein
MIRLKKSPEEVKDMIKLAIQKGYKQIKVSEVNPNEILLRVPGRYYIMGFEILSDTEVKYSCFENYSFKCIFETDAKAVREFLESIYENSKAVGNRGIKEIPTDVFQVVCEASA